MVQSRISDIRAVQYWDKGHLVAHELRNHLATDPSCCERKGILWDLVALYGVQTKWNGSTAVFADGPVVDAVPALQTRLPAVLGGAEP